MRRFSEKSFGSLSSLFFLIAMLFSPVFQAGLQAETISFKANTMTGSAGNSNKTTVLSGNAWIKTQDMEIYADTIRLSGTNYDTVLATGSVHGSNTKSGFAFSCRELKYNRSTQIAELSGNVVLDDSANDVHATASMIEYNQNTETAVMQLDVNITQKDSECTAALAVYRKESQMLELNGNPQVVRGSDVFNAQEITLNIDTQELTLDGKVRGTVKDGN